MTSTDAAMAALARLYGPDAETQRRCLPGCGSQTGYIHSCAIYTRAPTRSTPTPLP